MSKTTDTISGLRFQNYPESNEVHVHDDEHGLKFKASASSFKSEVENALSYFKDSDGATLISGSSKEQLCLVGEGKKVKAFVVAEGDQRRDIESFIKKL